MPVGAAIAGGLATAAGSRLFGGGGGSNALQNFKPIGIQAGGLTAQLTRLPGETEVIPGGIGPKGRRRPDRIITRSRGPQVIDVTASPERQALIGDIQNLLGEEAGAIGGLREDVLGRFGELQSILDEEFANAERRAVGDLSENLGRRRILGSSFAQDAISRARAEFGQRRAGTKARTRLQQLDIETELIGREFQLNRQAVDVALQELNQQANLAASLATGSTNALASNAQAQANLAAQLAQGQGALVGTIASQVGPAILQQLQNQNQNTQPQVIVAPQPQVELPSGATFPPGS